MDLLIEFYRFIMDLFPVPGRLFLNRRSAVTTAATAMARLFGFGRDHETDQRDQGVCHRGKDDSECEYGLKHLPAPFKKLKKQVSGLVNQEGEKPGQTGCIENHEHRPQQGSGFPGHGGDHGDTGEIDQDEDQECQGNQWCVDELAGLFTASIDLFPQPLAETFARSGTGRCK